MLSTRMDFPTQHDDVEEEEVAHVEDSLPSSPIQLTADEENVDAVKRDSPLPEPDDGAEPELSEQVDDRQCRICFAGPEEEDTLGRLISPCLCSGSMRYVHVACINAWRGTGTNKAYMECPQCHHHYRLRRTLVSGLATSRPILILSTGILFLSLTLTSGQILHLILRHSPGILRPSPSLFSTYDDGPVIIIGGGFGGGAPMDLVTASIGTVFDMMDKYGDTNWGQLLPSPLAGLALRFCLGLALLGSMSFVSLLLSLSLLGPMPLTNSIRGLGFLGDWGRRRARNEESVGVGTMTIILFVLIGAVNTLFQVYAGVQGITERLLKYVETQILEVNPDDRRKAEERHRARNTWSRRWLREKRWKTLTGWKEVYVRMRLRVEGWFNSIST